MDNLIQQLLMGARERIPQPTVPGMVGVTPQDLQQPPVEEDLESALNDPAFVTIGKKQNALDIRSKLEQFLSEDPGEVIRRQKQARLEAEKPKGKLGKFGNIMGEILAGLARAPESPNMARDRRINAEVRSDYDQAQQNAKDQLGYLRLNAKELTDSEKLAFQQQKLKLETLARNRNIDLKEKDQDFKKRLSAIDSEFKNKKLAETERHNRQAELYQERYLKFKYEDPSIKDFEEAVMRDKNRGLISLEEADKIIAAHYRNRKQPSKGILPKPSELITELPDGRKYKEYGVPKPKTSSAIDIFGGTGNKK